MCCDFVSVTNLTWNSESTSLNSLPRRSLQSILSVSNFYPLIWSPFYLNSQSITGSLSEEVVHILILFVSPGTPPSSAMAPCVPHTLSPPQAWRCSSQFRICPGLLRWFYGFANFFSDTQEVSIWGRLHWNKGMLKVFYRFWEGRSLPPSCFLIMWVQLEASPALCVWQQVL